MNDLSYDRFTLSNGLRVVVAPDHSAPIVAFSVLYDVGFRSEPEDRSGFAHLFEHLMFGGSESVSAVDLPRLIQGAGGKLNGTTSADYTAYHVVVPTEALDMALFLEADRMRAPAFTAEHLRTQVVVVQEEIRSKVLNRPYGQFGRVTLQPLLFDTFANTHDGWGDLDSVGRATVEECAAFFDTYYAPVNAVLTIVGDVTAADAKALVERHFSDVPERAAPARVSFDEPALASSRQGQYHDRLVPLAALAVGYRLPDPITQVDDYLAHLVLIDILVEGDSARLQRRLAQCVPPQVAGLGGSPLNEPFHVRHPDAFSINAFLLPGVEVEQILETLDDELDVLAHTPPSQEEVTTSTARWRAAVYQQLDIPVERAVGLGLFELLHGQAELLPRMPQRLDTITPEAVSAVAKDVFAAHRGVLTLTLASAVPGGIA